MFIYLICVKGADPCLRKATGRPQSANKKGLVRVDQPLGIKQGNKCLLVEGIATLPVDALV